MNWHLEGVFWRWKQANESFESCLFLDATASLAIISIFFLFFYCQQQMWWNDYQNVTCKTLLFTRAIYMLKVIHTIASALLDQVHCHHTNNVYGQICPSLPIWQNIMFCCNITPLGFASYLWHLPPWVRCHIIYKRNTKVQSWVLWVLRNNAQTNQLHNGEPSINKSKQ